MKRDEAGPRHPIRHLTGRLAWLWMALAVAAVGVSPADVQSQATTGHPVRKGSIPMPDGERLSFCTVGSGGDTVVVLHGGPGGNMEDAIFDPLARGRTLIYYDQRGGAGYPYGGNNPSNSHLLTPDSHVQDLEVIRRHFGLQRMTLVGHSWGTGLAALYTHTYPDRVNRLLLVGPMPVRRKPHFEQFLSNLHREFIQSLDLAGLADPLEGADSLSQGENDRVEPYWFRRNGADSLSLGESVWMEPYWFSPSCTSRDGDAQNTGVTSEIGWRSLGDWDWRPMLSTLEVPTLVVFGTSDNVPAASSEEWAESLPNARLLTFPGVGHFPHYEWPKQFYEAAENFLRGEWPPGARVRYRPKEGS